MSAGCSKCKTRWTSGSAAHCTLCHETFTAVSNFDRHRHPPQKLEVQRTGECGWPEDVGLERDHRGFWKTPGVERTWDA